MEVLKSNLHGANRNAQLFESGEEVEKVVRCEGELRWLDILSGKAEGSKGESSGQGRRRR